MALGRDHERDLAAGGGALLDHLEQLRRRLRAVGDHEQSRGGRLRHRANDSAPSRLLPHLVRVKHPSRVVAIVDERELAARVAGLSAGAEGPPAHRRRLLVAVSRAGGRTAAPGRLRRPRRRARRALGRARHVGQRPVADRAGGHLGRAAGRGARAPARVRVAPQGRRRPARADGEPAPHAVRRAALRVLQRGPAADRPASASPTSAACRPAASARRSSTSSPTTPRRSG